jgi:hypothetical protein
MVTGLGEKKLMRIAGLPVILLTYRYYDKKGAKTAAWQKTPDVAFMVGHTGGRRDGRYCWGGLLGGVCGLRTRCTSVADEGVGWVYIWVGWVYIWVGCLLLRRIRREGIGATGDWTRWNLKRWWRKALMEEFGNTGARIRYGLCGLDDGDIEEDDDSSSNQKPVISNASFYESKANTIVVSDWVSSIPARMEF